MHLRKVCVSLLLGIGLSAGAQESQLIDYSRADSIALHDDAEGITDVAELSRMLTAGVDSDHERFRVLFRWVAENVRYDFSASYTDPEKVLLKRKAKCAGYAALLKELCAFAFIRCEVVKGYAKGYSIPVGKIDEPNHAWNVVFLSGQWHLADVTWAAGFVHNRKFERDFTECYFLQDPVQFQHLHWPSDKRWFLTEPSVSKRRFFMMPLRYPDFYALSLELHSRTSGFLRRKLRLKLTSPSPIQVAYLRHKASGAQYFCGISESKSGYVLKLDCEDLPKGEYALIVNNGVPLMFVR